MRNYSLLRWKEFGEKDAPSIKTMFQAHPYPGMDAICDYLKKGSVGPIAVKAGMDVFTGEIISRTYAIQSDGEYAWSSMLPYYVKTYNMRLPKDFENKVLGKA